MVDLGLQRLISSIDKTTLEQIVQQLWQVVQQIRDDPVRLALSGAGSIFGFVKAGQFIPPNIVRSEIDVFENTDAYQRVLDSLRQSAREIQRAYSSVNNRFYFALNSIAYGVDYLAKRVRMTPELIAILEDVGWNSNDRMIKEKLVKSAMKALDYHNLGSSDYDPKGLSVFSKERQPVVRVNFVEGVYRPLNGGLPHKVKEIFEMAGIHSEFYKVR